jgi:hypothetical protein
MIKETIKIAVGRLLGPWALGFLLGTRMQRRQRGAGKLNVLALTRAVFAKDIEEIDRQGEINWFIAPNHKWWLGRAQKTFIPERLWPRMCGQRAFYPTLKDPECEPYWRKTESFGRGVLAALQMRGGVDAVVSHHIDYWQDEGLSRACRRRGIPFLAFCQENYYNAYHLDYRSKEFTALNFRFSGTAIATVSEGMRDFFIRHDVAPPDRIFVTGPARLDGWRRVTNAPERLIVLLAFIDPFRYHASDDYFFAIVDATLRGLASAGEGWRLVIKCKRANHVDLIKARIGDRPNVVVTHKMELPELLSKASVAIGSNSLSTLEALLSQAQLVVPLPDNDQPETWMFDPADTLAASCLRFARSVEEFESALSAVVAEAPGTIDRAARISLLKRYLGYEAADENGRKFVAFLKTFARPATDAAAAAVPNSPATERLPAR